MLFHQPFNSAVGNKYNVNMYKEYVWDFHFHKNFELIYITKGNVECIINNNVYTLEEGEFGLCLSNDIHSYKPKKGAEYWVCVFSEDCVPAFASLAKGKSGDNFGFRCDESVCKYVEEKLIKNEPQSLMALKSCLYAVCDQFLQKINLVERNTPKYQSMASIIDYVAQNYKSNIKLSDIADLLGYDYNYVSRYFHSVFNMSFKDFVNLYRLDTALELLNKGENKYIDIAFESGFQSIRSFNNCFKKQFGVCPSEYIKSRG